MGKLRAGIVGFGGMGQRHFRAYEDIDCEVTAICEFRPERVFEQLPNFPRERVYSKYSDLLEKENIDIISVVSNGPTHAEIVMAAAERGISRIFCEKPMATSLVEAEHLIDTVKKTGARVAVNHLRRWNTDYLKLLDMIEDGVIGKLRHIYFQSGSTGLGNFVIHAFDLMRFLSGSEAAWVMGALDQTGTPNPRGAEFKDPAGFGTVVFQNGVRGFVDSSEDTGVQYLFIVTGVYGRIIIDELNGLWEMRARNQELRSLPLTRYGETMEPFPFESAPYDIVQLTREGIRELAGDGPLSCTTVDGMKSLEMVVAFHESEARGNARVSLPLSGSARERIVDIA